MKNQNRAHKQVKSTSNARQTKKRRVVLWLTEPLYAKARICAAWFGESFKEASIDAIAAFVDGATGDIEATARGIELTSLGVTPKQKRQAKGCARALQALETHGEVA